MTKLCPCLCSTKVPLDEFQIGTSWGLFSGGMCVKCQSSITAISLTNKTPKDHWDVQHCLEEILIDRLISLENAHAKNFFISCSFLLILQTIDRYEIDRFIHRSGMTNYMRQFHLWLEVTSIPHSSVSPSTQPSVRRHHRSIQIQC